MESSCDLRHAIFDFAGTLAELYPSREVIVVDYFAHTVSIELAPHRVREAYMAVDALIPYSSLRVRSEEDRRDFYLQYNDRLLKVLGLSHLTRAQHLYEHFRACQPQWGLKVGALPLLQALQQRGVQVSIASNFDRVLQRIVRDGLKLESEVSNLFISQEMGVEKPDLDFFRNVSETLRLDRRTSVYVGDSYPLDFIPSQALGWQTFLLDESRLFTHLPQSLSSLSAAPERFNLM